MPPPKKNLIFVIVIVVILLIGTFLFFYYHPNAVRSREGIERMRQYELNMQSLEQEMAADVYGGRTPEETLTLFVATLREGDTAKAAKFFMPETDPFSSGHLSWEKFEEGLNKIKQDGNLQDFANKIGSYDEKIALDSGPVRFIYRSNNQRIGDVDLLYNQYADIWKLDDIF